MRLILIRHGQTPSNVKSQLDTAFPGAGLTTLGQTQAAALPSALSDYGIGRVFASPLLRTQLTAAPLGFSRSQGVQVVQGLEEISAGELEMKSDLSSLSMYADTVSAWIHGDLGLRMPGADDGHAFLDRFTSGLEDAIREAGDEPAIAVVSHGAAIRTFVAAAAGHRHDAGQELYLHNTGGAVLERRGAGRWELQLFHAEPFGGAALIEATGPDASAGAELPE